jgi:GTP pyrophosphokinase
LLKNTKNYFISYQTLSEEDKKLIRKAFDVSVEIKKKIRWGYISIHCWAKIVASEIGLGFDCRRIIT